MIGNRLVSHMGHFPQFKNQQDAYPVSNQKLENKDERGIKVIDTKYCKQINISSGQRNFILTFHNEADTPLHGSRKLKCHLFGYWTLYLLGKN